MLYRSRGGAGFLSQPLRRVRSLGRCVLARLRWFDSAVPRLRAEAAARGRRRYCGGDGACSAGREALAEAFAEILAADAGGLGLVGGVRVRCAVLGVAAEVAGLCVGVGNFVLAVVMLIVNAGVAVHVAAAVLARVAALGIASYIFPVCSVGCGLGSGNCVVSAVVRAWRSGGRMCPTRCALTFFFY